MLNLFLVAWKYIFIVYYFSSLKWCGQVLELIVEDKDPYPCIINNIVADNLATQGARISEAMILF